MSKRKIVVTEKLFEDGSTKYSACIQYSSFWGLVKTNYAVIKNENGSYDSKEFVSTFSSLNPTLFNSDSDAYREAKNCLKEWDNSENKADLPVKIRERIYSF